MTLLEVQNIKKTFANGKSEMLVLDDVSFSIVDEEFVCLVGPSGCGKSTLLRIISGLEKADSGKILFQDQPVTHPIPQISMVSNCSGCCLGRRRWRTWSCRWRYSVLRRRREPAPP